jgi:hypothetical protein
MHDGGVDESPRVRPGIVRLLILLGGLVLLGLLPVHISSGQAIVVGAAGLALLVAAGLIVFVFGVARAAAGAVDQLAGGVATAMLASYAGTIASLFEPVARGISRTATEAASENAARTMKANRERRELEELARRRERWNRIRWIGFPVVALVFFLAWACVLMIVWGADTKSFRGFGANPAIGDFLYVAVNTTFFNAPGAFAPATGLARTTLMVIAVSGIAVTVMAVPVFLSRVPQRSVSASAIGDRPTSREEPGPTAKDSQAAGS